MLRNRELYLQDLGKTLSTPEGRRIIYRIIIESGALNPSIISDTPELTAYIAGKKYIGHSLYLDITEHFPEMWPRMKTESLQEVKNYGEQSDTGKSDTE